MQGTGESAAGAERRFERDHDRPIRELIKDLGDQTSTLVRQELELARVELTRKGRAAGTGGGLMGAAALFGLAAFGAVVAAAIILLGTAIADWLAALVVAAACLLIAGVLALVGRSAVRKALPPMPEQTRENVRADIRSVSAHARAGRH